MTGFKSPAEQAGTVSPEGFGAGNLPAARIGSLDGVGADAVLSEPSWFVVAAGSSRAGAGGPLKARLVYAQVVAATILVVLAVAVFGALTSRGAAERQAVNAAERRANLLAEVVVEPALLDGIIVGEPAAVARLQAAVQQHVVGPSISRVKFWTTEGLVVYSNDPRLVGRTFPLSDEHRAVLADGAGRAVITNLDEPENVFERGEGKLLEVYRRVQTPGGQWLVMETYSPYSTVDKRAGEVWRDFATITIVSLLVLVLLLLPVLWRLLRWLKRSQAEREALLERAVDASAEERRRIAATLHDGVVQDLAGASLVVSGAAFHAEAEGRHAVAGELRDAASTVRSGITGLRSLLVDIYPPALSASGLEDALGDLVSSVRTRQIAVQLHINYPPSCGIGKDGERLVFRIAQECLRNTVRHASASAVEVRFAPDGDSMVLHVIDDGVGFDARAALEGPSAGHFGLRLMADAAAQNDAELRVALAAGSGTSWQLRVPIDRAG